MTRTKTWANKSKNCQAGGHLDWERFKLILQEFTVTISLNKFHTHKCTNITHKVTHTSTNTRTHTHTHTHTHTQRETHTHTLHTQANRACAYICRISPTNVSTRSTVITQLGGVNRRCGASEIKTFKMLNVVTGFHFSVIEII